MSEAPMPDQHPPAAPSSKNKTRSSRTRRMIGGRWFWILLLLVVIGVGVQQLQAVRVWETLDNEAGEIATVDGRLTALEAAMADQTRLRQDIQQMQQTLQQERALLGLDRIEQQLDAGWQIWQGTGDPKVLVSALQDAQRYLANEPGAAAQALRLAVGRDLVVLKSQQVIDLHAAVESIDTVIASIDKLPLIQDGRVPTQTANDTDVAAAEINAPTLLERGRQFVAAIAQDVWQAIRGMIRVQRLDRAESGLIAPEQKVFLQQGLRLLLLDARHALIMRNAAVYQQTLGQARAWITKYADASDLLVKSDLIELQRLTTLNIDPAIVSLEETRRALAAARAALTGEALTEAEPAPTSTRAEPAREVSTTESSAQPTPDQNKSVETAKGSAQ